MIISTFLMTAQYDLHCDSKYSPDQRLDQTSTKCVELHHFISTIGSLMVRTYNLVGY